MVTWGTSPQHAVAIDACVPQGGASGTTPEAHARALQYMGLEVGQSLIGLPITGAFIGSCTNSRLSDLRRAATILRGRKVAHGVRALCVPGSMSVTRAAEARSEGLTGLVRVTSPETFGVSWLAPQLAAFGLHHPGVNVELTPSGKVLDLGRGEAEIAVRFHRSRTQNLVVQRVAEVGYGLYASHAYLAEHPLPTPDDLRAHRLLLPPGRSIEGDWVARWAPGVRPAFASELSGALLAAARADAGVAVLPRYLGDPEAALCRIPLPDPPSEPVWLTVHEDLRDAPRVRAVLAFLGERLRAARGALRGEAAAAV
jgi:DNA-binding transcriptional LysR family regulator